METRTLLTVIALLLAGVITIMLVRTDGNDADSIFSSNYSEASYSPAGRPQRD